MCTVSFLPLGPDEYILSSNRDESPKRAHNPIIEDKIPKGKIFYPKDSKGGSWFFCSDFNWTLCLLNGAFVKHKHQPPYKMSRGLMLKHIFDFENIVDFIARFEFSGMEPFTCILIDEQRLLEFRWDGKEKHIQKLNKNNPYVWSSATLYPKEIQDKRTGWFTSWLSATENFSLDNIHQLHRTGGDGDIANDYVMNRNNIVCTTSITHVVKTKMETEMVQYDLITAEVEKIAFQNKIIETVSDLTG